jgi:hypothetical protein
MEDLRMQRRWPILAGLLLGALSLTALSPGQEQAPRQERTVPVAAKGRIADVTKLSTAQRQLALSAQRGVDWLQRANRPDGHFIPGYVPALRTPLEGDHYLRQVGAALALARASRLFGDERPAAVARQALLTLLLDTTTTHRADGEIRYTTPPSTVVNRLAAAGLLVLAISELPSPGADLLDQANQLCSYLKDQERPDGSLSYHENADTAPDPEGMNYYPGPALEGLIRSQQHRPAAWKLDALRKALPYYRTWWRGHKSLALVSSQTAAYSEAYLLTREPAFADFVNEMNDWVCTLQYQQFDPRRPLWLGGFMGWSDGKPQPLPPQITSASCAEALTHACRVARQAGDVPRFQRYREAVERCLQFVVTLQYTEANAQHFADWYRPALLGAFHASHQDGDLRLDYTQHAVGALVDYLDFVAELP